jgi:hypothetical protein
MQIISMGNIASTSGTPHLLNTAVYGCVIFMNVDDNLSIIDMI